MTAVQAPIADVLAELARSDERALESLFELLRIPSVSADVRQRPAMHEASRWIARAAAAMGFAVEVCETGGAPVVIAEWRKAGPTAPTALIYGHYDVQPPEPLTEWHSTSRCRTARLAQAAYTPCGHAGRDTGLPWQPT